MTQEEITAFNEELKEFNQKKKRVDMGKKLLDKINYVKQAIDYSNVKDKDSEIVYCIRKIVEIGGGLDKDATLSRNIKMFLTVLKEDYEKDFKNL